MTKTEFDALLKSFDLGEHFICNIDKKDEENFCRAFKIPYSGFDFRTDIYFITYNIDYENIDYDQYKNKIKDAIKKLEDVFKVEVELFKFEIFNIRKELYIVLRMHSIDYKKYFEDIKEGE